MSNNTMTRDEAMEEAVEMLGGAPADTLAVTRVTQALLAAYENGRLSMLADGKEIGTSTGTSRERLQAFLEHMSWLKGENQRLRNHEGVPVVPGGRAPHPADHVRVMRVVEYVGPRAAVEQAVANAQYSPDGSNQLRNSVTIRAFTLTPFGEVALSADYTKERPRA